MCLCSVELTNKLKSMGCVFEGDQARIDEIVLITEQARKNAKIVWSHRCIRDDLIDSIKYAFGQPNTIKDFKHQMIDADDPWLFLSETLNEK